MNTDNPTAARGSEQHRSRRGLLWIAGALAVALMGGSTFALWSSNATFTGGAIAAGDLNLAQTTDTAFYDVSADRTDATMTVPGTDGSQKGHVIDSWQSWRIVPGDKVALALSSDVTLSGDNLVAKLSITGHSDIMTQKTSMSWTYEIYKAGALLVPETALLENGTLLYLSAPGVGQADGQEDADGKTVFAMNDVTENLTFVIYGAFDATAGDAGKATINGNGVYADQSTGASGTRQDAMMASMLSGWMLQLDQVRDTGAVFGS